MTEQTYLTTTDPRALYDFCGERLTDRQCEMFVRACRQMVREEDEGHRPYAPWVEGRWRENTRSWCLYRDNDGLGWKSYDRQTVADIFRDIVGNPFHRILYPPFNRDFSQFLTWQDATIPKLAAACYEPGRCICQPPEREQWRNGGCERCNGTGTITPTTLDPFRLQVLGDALEDAGCTDEGLLEHLRETRGSRCEDCRGHHGGEDRCSRCDNTGYRPIQHYRGCRAIELFLPREEGV